MPFTNFLVFYFPAPIFLALSSAPTSPASTEALAPERVTILEPSSVDKLFDPYLSDFEPTSKLSSSSDLIEDERVTLKKVSYSKIGFFKTIFKEVGFEGKTAVLSALKALSKYFIITICLLVIDIVNERNFKVVAAVVSRYLYLWIWF